MADCSSPGRPLTRVAKQRSMIHRYASKIRVGLRATPRKLGRTFLQKHGRLIPKHAASKLAFVPMCGSDLIGSPKSGSNINKRVIEVVPVVTYYRRLFRAGRFRRSRVN